MQHGAESETGTEGAVYHVINRGNYREDVFAHESTKVAFLKCLGEACERGGRGHVLTIDNIARRRRVTSVSIINA